jgi:hypothetical protein
MWSDIPASVILPRNLKNILAAFPVTPAKDCPFDFSDDPVNKTDDSVSASPARLLYLSINFC